MDKLSGIQKAIIQYLETKGGIDYQIIIFEHLKNQRKMKTRLRSKYIDDDKSESHNGYKKASFLRSLERLEEINQIRRIIIYDELIILEKNYSKLKQLIQLLQSLDTDKPDTRSKKAKELGCLMNKRILEILILSLKSGGLNFKLGIIETLGETRDISTIGPLIQILNSTEEQIITAAKYAISKVGNPAISPLIQALDMDPSNQRNILEALKTIGTQAIDPLINLLNGNNSSTKEDVIDILADTDDPRITEILIEALKDNDRGVRERAIKAIEKRGKESVKPLLQVLKNGGESTRMIAAKSLGTIGDPSSVDPLIQALKVDTNYVRESAARALGEIKDKRATRSLIEEIDNHYIKTEVLSALEKIALHSIDPFIQILVEERDGRIRRGASVVLGNIRDRRAVEPLILTLRDINKDVRANAAEALGKIKDPRAVEPLILVLNDGDSGVRQKAAEALGKLEDLRATDPLILALKDSIKDVRVSTSEALGKIKDQRAVEPLILALIDSNKDVRGSIINALGELEDTRAITPLIQAIGDSDAMTRRKAAIVLGKFRDQRVVVPIIHAIGDSDEYVRQNAIRAIKEFKDPRAIKPLALALIDPNADVRRSASEVLDEMKDVKDAKDIGIWIELLSHDHARIYTEAITYITKIGIPAVTPLIKALRNDDKNIRQRAIAILGDIGDSRSVEPLIQHLDDEKDTGIKQRVIEALGKIKDTRSVEPIIQYFLKSDEIRGSAATALGNIRDKRAVSPLIQVLEGEYLGLGFVSQNEMRIIEALGKIGDPRAVETLVRGLKKGKERQSYVVEALRNINDSSAIESLIRAYNDNKFSSGNGITIDNKWPARLIIIKALGKIEGPRVTETLIRALKDSSWSVRQNAIEALESIKDPRAIEPLIQALDESDRDVRRRIVGIFGRMIEHPRVIEPLINALNDKDKGVQQSAEEVLKRIKDPGAIEPLSKALDDSNWLVRQKAVFALGNIKDPRVAGPLTQALNDSSKSVRQSAIKALQQRGLKPVVKNTSLEYSVIQYT